MILRAFVRQKQNVEDKVRTIYELELNEEEMVLMFSLCRKWIFI